MRNLILSAAALAALGGCVLPPVNRDASVPFGAVATIDPALYAGRWYEIARLPNWFERDCYAAAADYTLRPDGRIGVRNTCRRADGRLRAVQGAARIVDPVTKAKLKVRFGAPFEGDYWVLERDEAYAWALVGEPSGRFLWILAREPTLDPALRADLLARLEARGYDTSKLEWPQGGPGGDADAP